MDLSKIVKLLPGYIRAGICLEIRGNSGIGKTDMIRQFVWDMNSKLVGGTWGIGSHFFATYTPSDVTGYLMPREITVVNADGTTTVQTISVWSTPAWARADKGQKFEMLNDFDNGVLAMEEYDKAGLEVKKAAAPVQLYGGIGDFMLKPTIGRIMLTNHAAEGRQGSTKEFDFTISRKILVNATQSVSGWMDWALQNGVNPVTVAFAEEHPNAVFGNILPEKQGPFCNPRTLVMLDSVARETGLLTNDGELTDAEAFYETATGAIGSVATKDLTTFLKFRDDVPKWDEIVASPGKAKVSSNSGAQLMAAHICAFNVDDKTIEAAVTYIRRLTPSFHIVFIKAATRRNFRLVISKAMKKWTSEEPRLVALINALGGNK
jgi:hypothetical protein